MDTRTEKTRLADGVPMKCTDVVALDAIAYLSNTNFGNAQKVLMAIIALHEVEGIAYEDMLQLEDIPLELATTSQRMNATEAMVRRVAHSPKMCKEIARKLNVRTRFP